MMLVDASGDRLAIIVLSLALGVLLITSHAACGSKRGFSVQLRD